MKRQGKKNIKITLKKLTWSQLKPAECWEGDEKNTLFVWSITLRFGMLSWCLRSWQGESMEVRQSPPKDSYLSLCVREESPAVYWLEDSAFRLTSGSGPVFSPACSLAPHSWFSFAVTEIRLWDLQPVRCEQEGSVWSEGKKQNAYARASWIHSAVPCVQAAAQNSQL